MRRAAKPGALWLTAAMLVGVAGCRHRAAAAATVTATQPSVAKAPANSRVFDDKDHGFSALVPADWKEKTDEQNVLTVDGPKGEEFDIAVPKLPPHIPGMLPLTAIESGYVDDVRKRLKDVEEGESTAVKVAGASARRFEITGKDDAGERKLLVFAIAKGDHLYIITGEGPADRYDAVKSASENAAASWKWTK
jgi:hypothetical protein